MELTQDILNDLFPHSSIESLGASKYKVQNPWCSVDISSNGADLRVVGDGEGYEPYYLSFSGYEWEERLVEKVVDLESASRSFLVGPTKQGSLHLPSSYCVGYSEAIKTHSSHSDFYSVWRTWNSKVLLCSVYFHKKYLWGSG